VFSDDAISYVLTHKEALAMKDSMAVSSLASMFVNEVQRELRNLGDPEAAVRRARERKEMPPAQASLKRHVNIWNMVCDQLEQKHGVFILQRDGIKPIFAQVFSIPVGSI
jgi:hypothetical protein